MKKLLMITAGFILAFGLISCEKKGGIPNNENGLGAENVSKAVFEVGDTPGPTSDLGIVPEIIPGKNKGGNRTCEEVWMEFGDGDEVCGEDYLCGDKIDYDEGAEEFESDFPAGLKVTVSGIYISFTMDDCLLIDGKFWKVGAVIVKGSNAANVYWYGDEEGGGVTADEGLAAPGEKHMVSNLTFCFVPCEPVNPPKWVISLKTGLEKKVNNEKVTSYAYTPGDYPIPEDNNTTIPIGYHWLGFDEDFTLTLKGVDKDDAGTITATQVDDGGVPSILVVVTITVGDWDIYSPWLYIGSEEGIDGLFYQNFPFVEADADIVGNVATFLIPESEILL